MPSRAQWRPYRAATLPSSRGERTHSTSLYAELRAKLTVASRLTNPLIVASGLRRSAKAREKVSCEDIRALPTLAADRRMRSADQQPQRNEEQPLSRHPSSAARWQTAEESSADWN